MPNQQLWSVPWQLIPNHMHMIFAWVFGTFQIPKTLFTHGSEWHASEFTTPRPYAFIRWCDARADTLVKNRRALARQQPTATGPDASVTQDDAESAAGSSSRSNVN